MAAESTRSHAHRAGLAGSGRLSGDQVLLAPHDQAGAFQQLGLVVAQLAEQDPQLVGRAVHGLRVEVEQDDQDPGPLDVAQEAVAEALALGRALDQPGDVGHDELGAVAVPPTRTTPRWGSRVVNG